MGVFVKDNCEREIAGDTLRPMPRGAAAVDLASFFSHFYKCDESSGTLIDSIVAENFTDVNTCGTAAGKVGSARSLNHSATEFFRHDTQTFGKGKNPLYLVGWSRWEPKGNANHMAIAGRGGVSNRYEYLVYMTFADQNTPNNLVMLSSPDGSTFDAALISSGLPAASTWFMWEGWINGTETAIALNGGTPVAVTNSGLHEDTVTKFAYGNAYDAGSFFKFNGRMDALGIAWAKPTDAERAAIWNNGNGWEPS